MHNPAIFGQSRSEIMKERTFQAKEKYRLERPKALYKEILEECEYKADHREYKYTYGLLITERDIAEEVTQLLRDDGFVVNFQQDNVWTINISWE